MRMEYFPSFITYYSERSGCRHAYRLLRDDADCMRREAFDSSATLSIEALKLLDMETLEAEHVGEFFTNYDGKKLRQASKLWGTE